MTTERQEILEIWAELSELYPEVRMGQWLTSFASAARGSDVEAIYDAEDEDLLPIMRQFLANRKRTDSEVLVG
jgi:hypothetical protein